MKDNGLLSRILQFEIMINKKFLTPEELLHSKLTFVYNVLDYRIIDGDTIEATVDLGFCLTFKSRFRLAWVNAPEKNEVTAPQTLCRFEQLLKQSFEQKSLMLFSLNKDKYGRFLAVLFDKRDLTKSFQHILLEEGLVKLY